MNVITIAGNLGKDAELRHTSSGDAVASFSIADSQGKDKETLWWRCQLWGKRAESLSQYLTKGSRVTVSGSVSERKWTDKEGTERTTMEVRVSDLALQGGGQEQRQEPQRPRQRQDDGSVGGMSDDIPF